MTQIRMLRRIIAILLSMTLAVGPVAAQYRSDFKEYDAKGRVIAEAGADGQLVRYTYDGGGSREVWIADRLVAVEKPDGTVTAYAYNANGRRTVTRITKQGSEPQYITHDDAQSTAAIQTVPTESTTPAEMPAEYMYDELGNLIFQRDARGNATGFEYDKMRRETKRCLADGKCETREYDVAGNRLSRRDYAGQLTTYKYDVNDRLILRTAPDGAEVKFEWLPMGQLLSMEDHRGKTTYGYSVRDWPTSATYPDGRKLEYAYDANGNRTGLTVVLRDGTRLTTSYTFDDGNRPETLTDPADRTARYEHDPTGNRTSLAYPNGITTSFGYDSQHRLTSLFTSHASGRLVQRYDLTLGPAGHRMKVVEHEETVREYGYDGRRRLTLDKVMRAGQLSYEKVFSYDAVGNRLTQTTTSGTSTAATVTYAYDTRDRLTTENGANIGYDDNGNLTRMRDGTVLTWNSEHQLVAVAKPDGALISHEYDGLGNRVLTRISRPGQPTKVTDFLVDIAGSHSQVVAETDGTTGALNALYVRGALGDPMSVMRPEGGEAKSFFTRYLHADGIGSIRVLTDDDGLTTDTYTYSAFGELLSHTGTAAQPYAFAGEPLDRDSGLQYHRARWMDPRTGTFASMDPYIGSIFDPPSLHRYLYAAADPVNKVDPSGASYTVGQMVGVGAMAGILAANAILRPRTFTETVQATVAGGTIGGLLGLGAGLYMAGAYVGGATVATGAGATGIKLFERVSQGIRATQEYLNPAKVEQYRQAMLRGQWRFQSMEGQIGGWRDQFGRYFIGEGHHRMAAALKILRETGNPEYVKQLLEYGRWTPGAPGIHYPFPPLP